jgi:acetyl-CoA C-acetyltransferase
VEETMPGSVIVSSARTPIGKLSGGFASLSATDLGGRAIAAALERAGIAGDKIDAVIMGQVLQAGAGQITARQAAVAGGIPMTVPAVTINKVCLSGVNAIYLADQMIQAGDADVVVAGGMESMTNAPYLLPQARAGFRMGNGEVVDSMINDGLWCAFDAVHMGAGTEKYVGQVGGITREAQDELAAKSHERAAAAQKEGRLAEEIAAVEIAQRRGDPIVIDADEGVRPGTTTESLGGLRPAFSKDGTITAGNASQISDGGAAVIVASRAAAEKLGLTPMAELVGFGMVAGPDPSLLHQPSNAIRNALERSQLSLSDIDLFEINEAFAAVGLASLKDLGIGDEVVNVNGGAIALGHPIGMSGTRIVITLINELRRRGGGTGAAALCGGGGQGDAAIVRTI